MPETAMKNSEVLFPLTLANLLSVISNFDFKSEALGCFNNIVRKNEDMLLKKILDKEKFCKITKLPLSAKRKFVI